MMTLRSKIGQRDVVMIDTCCTGAAAVVAVAGAALVDNVEEVEHCSSPSLHDSVAVERQECRPQKTGRPV